MPFCHLLSILKLTRYLKSRFLDTSLGFQLRHTALTAPRQLYLVLHRSAHQTVSANLLFEHQASFSMPSKWQKSTSYTPAPFSTTFSIFERSVLAVPSLNFGGTAQKISVPSLSKIACAGPASDDTYQDRLSVPYVRH